jgi:hypothetical protein
VAAITRLTPLTDRGRELLDQLEERTQVTPSEIEEASGARTYHLASERAGVDAFDVMLDYIDPDWHEQLTRTGP